MTWDTNWSTTGARGKLLKNALADILGAVNERCNAINISTLGALPTNSIYNSQAWQTFIWLIQSKVTTLIPEFVNYNDNSGNWDEQTTIPEWTESTLMSYLQSAGLQDDTTRLSAPTDPQVSGAWLNQQYNILNQLKWIKVNGQFYRSFKYTGNLLQPLVTDWPTTWQVCIDTWTNDRAWGSYAWASEAFQGSAALYNVSGNYELELINYKTNEIRATVPGSVQATADFYAFAENDIVRTNYTFSYASQDGFTEDKHNSIASQTTGTTSTISQTFTEVMDTYTTRPADPDAVGPNGNGYYCSIKPIAVLKFDDAFEYVAP